jgi:electron transfer flavoprotein alpha subunit
VAVLVKQVPRVEDMELAPDGRLRRDGVELEMNAYCRRAVSKGVELAKAHAGTCTVLTLGPPMAEDVLREAVAWGADEGVLVSDPACGGSDTLATASTLAVALAREGPFDLVLVGRNSIDADTGQVGPELAELLDLPFAAGVRTLTIEDGVAEARCELDDGWREVRVVLPAVLSTAERLTEPCKVPPEGRAAVEGNRIRRLSAADLGPGPFGAAASPTVVGAVRSMEVTRRRVVLSGTVDAQVEEAVSLLRQWGALQALHHCHAHVGSHGDGHVGPHAHPAHFGADSGAEQGAGPGVEQVPVVVAAAAVPGDAPVVAVVVEPGRARVARELLGEGAQLARAIGGTVLALGPAVDDDPVALARWGADGAVSFRDVDVEEDVAASLVRFCRSSPPWAVLVPGTLWGREVAGRAAARLRTGLTGDAVGFGVEDGRLVAWKPAFGGSLVAAITCTSPVQMATVRPGVLALRAARAATRGVPVSVLSGRSRRRVTVTGSGHDDHIEALLSARAVVAVGQGVDPDAYGDLDPFLDVLGAELAASRKVTDKGWLPRARQVGITGHSVAPALYVAVGVSGKFNHVVGTRSAGVVMAVNCDPDAAIFGCADVGIVADWREAVPLLVAALG